MDSGSPLLRFSATTSNFCTSVQDNSGLKQQYLTLTASGVRNRGAFHKPETVCPETRATHC